MQKNVVDVQILCAMISVWYLGWYREHYQTKFWEYTYNRQKSNKRIQAIKRIKKEEKQHSMIIWQTRWDSTDKGRWTYKHIPVIKTWSNRTHGKYNYQLTQFLSGHGGYCKYLYRFGHDSSPICPACNDIRKKIQNMPFSNAIGFEMWGATVVHVRDC